jgi:hypothetical protein
MALAYTFEGSNASRISFLGASLYQFGQYFVSNQFLIILHQLLLNPFSLSTTILSQAFILFQVILNFSQTFE